MESIVTNATGKFRRLAALLTVLGLVLAAHTNAFAVKPDDDEPGPTGGALFGTIVFEGIVPDAPVQEVTFEVHAPDNAVLSTQTQMVGPDGRFTITGMPQGNYYLRVKADRYLATKQHIVSNASGVSILLRTGDATNDNFVDVDDLASIIRAFNAVRGQGGRYTEAADCNVDGVVDWDDLDLFIQNFDTEGDW